MRLHDLVARRLWILAAVLGLALGTPARAQPAPGVLVTPEWLDAQLQGQAVLLLDASMPQQYASGHIPGAVNAVAMAGIGREVALPVMERLLQSWGVGPGRKIVVYDEGGSWMATRLFHDLHYHGVPAADLHLLDGGLHRWKAAGKPVAQERTPAPPPGTFRIAGVVADARVRLDEFLLATGDPARHAVVDALEAPYYYGGAKFFDRAGHVPNALLWPSSDFFDPQTKRFKPPEEIARMATHLGIRPEQTVHVYCGGGGAASVPVFALRFLLGREKVKLYNESQREWLQDERGLPVWTHAAPQRVRRAAWLDGWATNPMLRQFGLSRVSVVDLRPAEAYRQGHVPAALNIPAATFRTHLDQPERLAALLGAAGLPADHEAVVVTDGGLTPATALALLMLERAGQHKVSWLADSFDDWALGGYAVSRDAGATAAAAYPAPRPAAGRSVYPRVFLAAGREAPLRAPGADGARLIHLPYTDLLDAGGSPKAAKDLWSVLAKAGVPRFAEIVTIADDPGEAAVSWFVLKLMGFADVRVGTPG